MTVKLKEKESIDREKLLKILTYEVVDGKPIYYKGYKEVLQGKKPPEAVMGASPFHARLVGKITSWLTYKLGNSFEVWTGELGYRVAKGWRNLDIAVFRYEDVKDKLESEEYIDVPPLLVFEINVKADVESEMEYITKKTEQLLESGVGKVVWIFTKGRKVLVAEKGKSWVIKGWNEDIELIENLKLNIDKLLNEWK